MTYMQSKAEPCQYFAWVNKAMVVFVAWVNEVMVLGPPSLVEQVQHDLEQAFTCKREGELTKYIEVEGISLGANLLLIMMKREWE